jgi:integrase
MITTPLRAAEGAELTWGQIDASRAEISLSSDETKNAEHFIMPLSPTAISVIEADHPTHDQLVFPLSARTGEKMTSWSHFNRCVRAASGIDSFILHDLRRTFSTLMAENTDVSETIIDSLLNHKQSATRGGVIRHYQQAKHLETRRDVMKEWGKLLEAWI